MIDFVQNICLRKFVNPCSIKKSGLIYEDPRKYLQSANMYNMISDQYAGTDIRANKPLLYEGILRSMRWEDYPEMHPRI